MRLVRLGNLWRRRVEHSRQVLWVYKPQQPKGKRREKIHAPGALGALVTKSSCIPQHFATIYLPSARLYTSQAAPNQTETYGWRSNSKTTEPANCPRESTLFSLQSWTRETNYRAKHQQSLQLQFDRQDNDNGFQGSFSLDKSETESKKSPKDAQTTSNWRYKLCPDYHNLCRTLIQNVERKPILRSSSPVIQS